MKRRLEFFLAIALALALCGSSALGVELEGDHDFSADGSVHYCMNENHREAGGGDCPCAHENGEGGKYGCKLGCCGGHKYKIIEKVSPTYTQKGYTLYECENCFDTMKLTFENSLWALYGGAKKGGAYRLTGGVGNRIYAAGFPALLEGWSVSYKITLPGGALAEGTALVGANGEATLLSGDAIVEGEYGVRAAVLNASGDEMGRIDCAIRILASDARATSLAIALESEGAQSAAEDMAVMTVVTRELGGGVNLRKGPTLDAEVICQAYAGDALTVLERNAAFYKVTTGDGQTGYIAAEYLAGAARARIGENDQNIALRVSLADENGSALADKTLYACLRVQGMPDGVYSKGATNAQGDIVLKYILTRDAVYEVFVNFEGDAAYDASRAVIAISRGSADAAYTIYNLTPEADREMNLGYIAIDKTAAKAGDAVTVTPHANEGYRVNDVTCAMADAAGGERMAPSRTTDGAWIFTIPEDVKADAIYISASFLPEGEGWLKADAGWRYFKDGKMVTGWMQDGGNDWFYIDPSTGYLATGWFQDGAEFYYAFTEEDAKNGGRLGTMARNQWIRSNEKWYYVNQEGKLETNKWVRTSSSAPWSYVGADGSWLYDAQ